MKKMYAVKNIFLAIGCAALLPFASTVLASEAGHHGMQEHGVHAGNGVATTPEATIKNVLEGNDKFNHNHDHHDFDAYQKGQTPALTVITCSDSRVHTHAFGMDPHNNIFIIRNVGNQIRNSEGSVDYGVRHLPTKILLVMGHSSCGAVKAAMGDYSGETTGIKAELDPLKPVIDADDKKGDDVTRWGKNVERNVDYQVKYAMELYADKVKSGELVVVGGVYDFNNLYGKGRGALVVTNVNGEADPNKIIGLPVLKEIDKGLLVNHVGSLAPKLD